jgi:hypothetical protein
VCVGCGRAEPVDLYLCVCLIATGRHVIRLVVMRPGLVGSAGAWRRPAYLVSPGGRPRERGWQGQVLELQRLYREIDMR